MRLCNLEQNTEYLWAQEELSEQTKLGYIRKYFSLPPRSFLSDLGVLWNRHGGKSTFWSLQNVKNKEIKVCTE